MKNEIDLQQLKAKQHQYYYIAFGFLIIPIAFIFYNEFILQKFEDPVPIGIILSLPFFLFALRGFKIEKKVNSYKKLSFEKLYNASENRVKYLLERKIELENEISELKRKNKELESK